MKKIPTLFLRDADRHLTPNVHPDCQWVLDGEGVPTLKLDGTCCLVRDGKLYKRRELRPGDPAPTRFELADSDPITGKRVGWMPVDDMDRWHIEAWVRNPDLADGTYELIGPKVQGNPDRLDRHELISHDALTINKPVPRSLGGLILYFSQNRNIEGIVWHHPDGRRAKLKLRDLKIERLG